jgi:hypothetical protein
MAVRGDLLLVSDDAEMMEAMLARVRPQAVPVEARLVAGFDLDAVAGPFAQLSALLDRADAGTDSGSAQAPGRAPTDRNPPAFFSGDLAGLSGMFAALQSERVVERWDGTVVHQTVTYAWRR